MDLSSSYVDEVDNSMEFELVGDYEEPGDVDEDVMSSSFYVGLELPDPEDNTQDIFTCSGCYTRMDKVMMLVTKAGVCDHHFCTSCIDLFRERAGSENFNCPSCGQEVISVCENRYAIELASVLQNNQITPAQLKELENQNENLEAELARQRQEFELLHQRRTQERNSLRKSLDSEREQKKQLTKQMEEMFASHSEYKSHSESLIHELDQKIKLTKQSASIQLQNLEQEREKLLQMQQNEKQQTSGAIDALEQHIKSMEKELKVNNVLQKNLERMCQKTVSELHEREGEVKNVRAQMKKESLQRTKSQGESIIDSLSRSVTGFIWNAETEQNKVDLVKPISLFDIREIRGNRKDGRVRKAVTFSGGSVVALKRVKFNSSVLSDQSVLSTLGSFWRSKSAQDIEIERIRRIDTQTEAFREAMLLFKLNSDYLLPLNGIVNSPEAGEFYLEIPFVEFDLDYAVESRGASINDKTIQSIIYQLLLGIYYLHSGNIVHRHLSPATILTNDVQRIFIAGTSFAISIESPTPFPAVSCQHVDCIAPELLFMSSEQQPATAWKPIDMWAVGTILAFLLRQQPLFKGTQTTEVLASILSVSDCAPQPGDELISKFFPLKKAYSSLEKSNRQSKTLKEKFSATNSPSAVDLCSKLLRFHPGERLTAEEALRHPYFQNLSVNQIPAACTVGFECKDEDISIFVEQYCPSVFC